MCYYSRYFNDQSLSFEIHTRLSRVVNNINNMNDNATFAGGVCGVVWLLEHLTNEGFIEYDLEELYWDTDEYLYEYMIYHIKNNNYDFLHGALGIANYFLNRNTAKTDKYLLHFINLLSENSIVDTQYNSVGFKSLIINTDDPFTAYNFSLSHGMASILYFLQRSLLSETFKKNSEINYLISGLNNFFQQNQNDITNFNSYFPTWIGDTNIVKNARIAWCYGDLGIGITYLNYGKNHLNNKLSDYGIAILSNTLNRKDIQAEKVMDAGVCHGSSGISMIYERAFTLTRKKEFMDASEYWINVALHQSTHFDGVCGYKSYTGVTRGYVNETGFLEGISGIGLVFISKLDTSLGNWKKAFIIS